VAAAVHRGAKCRPRIATDGRRSHEGRARHTIITQYPRVAELTPRDGLRPNGKNRYVILQRPVRPFVVFSMTACRIYNNKISKQLCRRQYNIICAYTRNIIYGNRPSDLGTAIANRARHGRTTQIIRCCETTSTTAVSDVHIDYSLRI